MSSYTVILNPKSGSGQSFAVIQSLCRELRELGHLVEIHLSRSLRHVELLTLEARAAEKDTVIAAGGDGTISKALECLACSGIPLLVIPTGTENLLACEYGLDGSLGVARRALLEGQCRKLDLARANERVFMAVAGFGFDAEVIRRLHQIRTGHIMHSDYFWPLSRTFWEYPFPTFRVEADGVCVNDEPALVFVGNISRYATGLDILPEADGSDGRLDLTIFRCRDQLELLRHSWRTLRRQVKSGPRVVRQRCKHIRVSSPDTDGMVQLDGDPGPRLPIEIEIMPAAARILTPPAPKGKDRSTPVRYYMLRRWLTR